MSSRLLYLVYKALHSPVLRPVNNFPLCLGLWNSLGVTVLLQATGFENTAQSPPQSCIGRGPKVAYSSHHPSHLLSVLGRKSQNVQLLFCDLWIERR